MSGLKNCVLEPGEYRQVIDCIHLIKQGDYSLLKTLDDRLYSSVAHYLMIADLNKDAFSIAQSDHRNGNLYCTGFIGLCYLYGMECEINPKKGAQFIIKSTSRECIINRLVQFPNMESVEKYIYGQNVGSIKTWISWHSQELKFLTDCEQLYNKTTALVRQSTLCLIWCLTLSKYCSKDVARMIAKLVYESRYEPDLWI
jgi:hypothetical protein